MTMVETIRIKRALQEAGMKAQVKHGTGTASAWLKVAVTIARPLSCTCATPPLGRPTPWLPYECSACREARSLATAKATRIVKDAKPCLGTWYSDDGRDQEPRDTLLVSAHLEEARR